MVARLMSEHKRRKKHRTRAEHLTRADLKELQNQIGWMEMALTQRYDLIAEAVNGLIKRFDATIDKDGAVRFKKQRADDEAA
jgi:hypothetical protein